MSAGGWGNSYTVSSPYVVYTGSQSATLSPKEYDLDRHKGHFVTLAKYDGTDAFNGELYICGARFRPYCLDCKDWIKEKNVKTREQDITNGKGKELLEKKDETKLGNEEMRSEI